MTDSSWDPAHYPAPQPSETFSGERMPLAAHPEHIAARFREPEPEPVWNAEHPGHLAACDGSHARSWDPCPGQDDAIVATEAEAIAYLTRDGTGSDRVPVSRYGSTGAECAPVAYRAARIVASECGEPLRVRDLDYAMGMAVNDHDDIANLLSEYGEREAGE